jgi:uncharacterized protein YwgA
MMKKSQRDAVLLSLVREMITRGSWCGETHIQKAAYFLQALLGVPLEFDFILYKHGPFSFDLIDEITALRADALLRYQTRPYPYGSSIVPTDEAQSFLDSYPKTLKRYADQISFVADKLGEMGVTDLERLATALYVTLNQDGQSGQRAEQIPLLKPHISLEEADLAVQRVDEIMGEARGLCISIS